MKILYAGKGMTMWETLEEAEASWTKTLYELISRTAFPFWRADRIEVIEEPVK